jgi:hypothetical protein
MRGFVCLLVTLISVPTLAAGPPPRGGAARDAQGKPADATLIEVVPDLPDFPAAVMVSSEEKGPADGWTHSWKRETRTTASFDDVRKFYLGQFEKKGWLVTATKEKSNRAEWVLSKGSRWGRVKLEASSGLTKITAEWKTR